MGKEAFERIPSRCWDAKKQIQSGGWGEGLMFDHDARTDGEKDCASSCSGGSSREEAGDGIWLSYLFGEREGTFKRPT